MVLGVPSPPWLRNRSRVALLFTAYGRERSSQWALGRGGIKNITTSCGCGVLNLTPWLWLTAEQSQVWLRGQTAVCGNLFSVCWAAVEWPQSPSGNRRRKNKNEIRDYSFLPHTHTNTHLKVCRLYLLRPGGPGVACLSCGTCCDLVRCCCFFEITEEAGGGCLPAVQRALVGTVITVYWLPVWSY